MRCLYNGSATDGVKVVKEAVFWPPRSPDLLPAECAMWSPQSRDSSPGSQQRAPYCTDDIAATYAKSNGGVQGWWWRPAGKWYFQFAVTVLDVHINQEYILRTRVWWYGHGIYPCLYVRVCACMHICMLISLYASTYRCILYTHVCVFLCVYVCICVCMCLYSDTSANEDNSFRNHIR